MTDWDLIRGPEFRSERAKNPGVHVRLGYLDQEFSYVVMLAFIVALIVSDHPRKSFILDRVGVGEDTAVEQVAEKLPVFVPLLDEAVAPASQL